MNRLLVASVLGLSLAACQKTSAPEAVAPPTPEVALPAESTATALADEDTAAALALGPTATDFKALARADFNRGAAEQDLPLYWRADTNKNAILDADELAVTWPGVAREWLENGKLTARFGEAYGLIQKLATRPGAQVADASEKARRETVLAELRQGRPTLIYSDFSQLPAGEKAFVQHMLNAAERVEDLFALQSGTVELAKDLPPHRPSHALFHRNQGPWCEAPQTEQNPDCNALRSRPQKISGVYPADIQRDKEFCTKLDALPNHDELLGPFAIVKKDDNGKLFALPYFEAWPKQMLAVAGELTAAADALETGKIDEPALIAYLRAAANAFSGNDRWFLADEAWAKMEGKSKWYVRIAPDETYHEPCARKAGFHMSFARVNQDAVAWQNLLEPIKAQLEHAIAVLAGPPYKSGKTNFHLPNFIDIAINAADSRSALGATVGQSLPNWGPVANESRGRTVAMANLYTDLDSQDAMRTQVQSLFCKDSADQVPTDPESLIMTTVLHEAGHNLGPAHEYKVKGLVDDAIFGGPLAATLEELKAETSALYLADWLVDNHKLAANKRDAGQAAGVAWAMGHIAQGMTTPSGKPKPYSQLSAVQVGALYDAKALTWHADTLAANGKDKGCFSLHKERVAPAVKALMTQVAQIKGRGDKAAAEKLLAPYVAETGEFATLRGVIRERWLRVPKAAFVYAVKLD
jgi:hypothetical protein